LTAVEPRDDRVNEPSNRSNTPVNDDAAGLGAAVRGITARLQRSRRSDSRLIAAGRVAARWPRWIQIANRWTGSSAAATDSSMWRGW